jgi:HSP20 family protein
MNLVPYRKRGAVNKFSPFGLIEDLQSDLNRFFDSSLLNMSKDFSPVEASISNWLPHTDIHDSGDKLVVKTDLPGLDKNDIEVTVQGNTLFIRGEKKHEDNTQDIGYLKSERYFGQFERALPLTDDIDQGKIDASYKNGVLTVTIAKREEAKPKQITVNIK